jgi:oxygen-independent coproporphyrinogen-3 oxidase
MVEDRGHATRASTPVTPGEALEEMLMMGLRLGEGVALDRLAEVTGRPLSAWIEDTRLEPLIEGGFLELGGARIRATPAGRRVLDALLPRLLA